MQPSLPTFGFALLLAGAAVAADPLEKETEFFEQNIRPVLIKNCYECHSAEAAKAGKLEGELQLDTRAGIRAGGESGPAVVPGDVKKSLLLTAIQHQGPKMPPKDKLPDAVVADFVKWVAGGAADPRDGESVKPAKPTIDVAAGRKHWAFQPLQSAAPPAVKNASWPRGEIDRYILARLEAAQLAPNPPAAKETLLRRAYLDLSGLPPSPADIDAFLKDDSPQAYEKLLDRLLAGEHYGERWARHWFDVVRFAESGGYEFDGNRGGAYHYRDFVIRALNQDMPYDQFVRLQVAGDRMQPNDYTASAATGFLVAGPYPGQTTAKTQELIRYNHLDDMVSTLGTGLLGLSFGCARCHDHKFDPIPQSDYYALIANLSRTDSTEAKLDPQPEIYRKAKAEYDAAHAPLVAAQTKFEQEELAARVKKWWQDRAAASPAPGGWLVLDLKSTGKTTFGRPADGSLLATGKAEKNETYTFTAKTQHKQIKALRIEALADPSLPKSGPGRDPEGRFSLTDFTIAAKPLNAKEKAKPDPIKLKPIQATSAAAGGEVALAVDADKKTGWGTTDPVGTSHSAVFEIENNPGYEGGAELTITLKFENEKFGIGRVRVSLGVVDAAPAIDAATAPQAAAELRVVLQPTEGGVTPENLAMSAHWFRPLDPDTQRVYTAVEDHAKAEPQPKLVGVFVAQSNRGGDVHFLTRGEVDRKQKVASPGFVQVLMSTEEGNAQWLKPADKSTSPVDPRIALAGWLTDTDRGAGVLLARTIVNRLWQHHFGRGLVATPNDFGTRGDPPTHPELLDYLAGDLIRGGWQLKRLHKQIMLSAAYQLSSDTQPQGMKTDPANLLWWRQPVRRLEAEAIRDSLLAVGGTLDPTMYGPGTLDENSPRRSVYLTVKRAALIPLLQAFDAPDAIQSIGGRSVTTVPSQTLAFMNSPLVRQAAEKLAKRAKPTAETPLDAAVAEAYRIALARRPADAERERMLAFINDQAARYPTKSLDIAFADFCQVLLCLNEFVYVE